MHRQFTHIVVGAGSAGCLVARRVAENRAFEVLLIEAGPDIDPTNTSSIPHGVQDARRVPMAGQSAIFDPRIDWNLEVEVPGGGQMIVPQAKVMGGGSSINGGTFLRHTEADAREWVALGNDGWDFESSVAVYEGLEGDTLRGTRGPHPIVRASMDEAGKIQAAFVDGVTSTSRHLRRIPDLNATGAEGVGPSPVCRRGSTRISAADTFIGPARLFPNLTILANSVVDRVLFQDGKAVAVVLANGRKIHATHEIILCAGAVFSPAILQRSGIGPTELLRQHGIALVAELPVGLNLSDHPCIPLVARPRPGAYSDTDYSLQMQARWSSSLNPGAIDLQMVCFSYLFVQPADPSIPGKPQRSLGGTETGHVAGIGCNINKPTSLGTVEIRSRDPNQIPIVRPNYLSTRHDRALAREIVRTAYAVLTSPAMQTVLTAPLGITSQVVADDAMLDGYIQAQYSTTYHFCGSCRMASREKGGVVDQSGRVYGVNGLRVADASILPTVPAANTMASSMLVGERVGRSVRDGRSIQKAARSHI